jgi:hypothetical protein
LKHEKTIIILLAGLAVLMGIALGVSSAHKAGFSNPDLEDSQARWNDLRVFYGAGRWAFKDINLYKNPTSPEGRFYIFPPFFAIICAPFAALGWKAFVIIWFVVSFAGILIVALLCAGIARHKTGKAALVVLAFLALALCARPVISDFQNGQVNSFIFLLTALSLFLFVRRQDGASGIVMAFAASIKLTALIFLPYFIFKGAYKTALGMLLGLLFTLFLLPMVCFGPARMSSLYSSFYGKMVGPFTSVSEAPEVYSAAGQSLRAAAGRYLTDTNAAHHADYEIRVNFANLPESTVWKIVLAGCVVLTLITAFCARANPADKSRRDLIALELGAVLLLMLMVSPMSRKAHFVVLMLPFAAALNYLQLHRGDPQRRGPYQLLFVVTAAAFVIFNLTSPDVVGKKAAVYLLALSSFFFATIALYLASCLTLLKERPVRKPRPSR